MNPQVAVCLPQIIVDKLRLTSAGKLTVNSLLDNGCEFRLVMTVETRVKVASKPMVTSKPMVVSKPVMAVSQPYYNFLPVKVYKIRGYRDSYQHISGLYCIEEYHNGVLDGFMIYTFKAGQPEGRAVACSLSHKLGFAVDYKDGVWDRDCYRLYEHELKELPQTLDARIVRLFSSPERWLPGYRAFEF